MDKLSLLIWGALTLCSIRHGLAFTTPIVPSHRTVALLECSTSFTSLHATQTNRICRARDLIKSLVEEEECFTTEMGARAFHDVCAVNVVYEDRFCPQPFNGKSEVLQRLLEKVEERQKEKKGNDSAVRIDKISDGNSACGFAWTWTCGSEEGLRGTTYVELNDNGQIQYVSEIPEPIFKPGDLTRQLLEAVTAGAEEKPTQPLQPRENPPVEANEIAKYLYVDLQNADRQAVMEETLKLFDDKVIYRDFNFEDVFRGKEQVREFIQDFSFPGIEFRPLRFDDGVDSTCFTWEVVLDGAEDTIKGMSFYELDPSSRKIVYVRDVPESAIKPPILGTWARQLRPGLGVFQGAPIGSRPNGL